MKFKLCPNDFLKNFLEGFYFYAFTYTYVLYVKTGMMLNM